MDVIENIEIPSGSMVLIGKPKAPLDKDSIDAIKSSVLNVSGVCEAHLPQCYALDYMAQPEQLLFIVPVSDANVDQIKSEVVVKLRESGLIKRLLVWVVDPQSAFVGDVRNTGCQLV